LNICSCCINHINSLLTPKKFENIQCIIHLVKKNLFKGEMGGRWMKDGWKINPWWKMGGRCMKDGWKINP
jgi:hypothetical protein